MMEESDSKPSEREGSGVFSGRSTDGVYDMKLMMDAIGAFTGGANLKLEGEISSLKARAEASEAREMELRVLLESAEARELSALRAASSKDAELDMLRKVAMASGVTTGEKQHLLEAASFSFAQKEGKVEELKAMERSLSLKDDEIASLRLEIEGLRAERDEANVKVGDSEATAAWLRSDLRETFHADNHGRTPLHLAAAEGNLALVQTLVSKGADLNVRNRNGNTPLIKACELGHFEVAKHLLVNSGALINLKNCRDETALHWASRNGYLEVVKLLVYNGAEVGAKSENGKTARDWAKSRDCRSVAAFLKG